ncbi:hypothetical protein JCM9279_004055 [Rhodotorula babjevae]
MASPPPPDDDPSPLAGVRAILYDQFGTLTDWESSVSGQLAAQVERGDQGLEALDWLDFTRRWRNGYMTRTREIAAGKPGPGNIDDLHLEERLFPSSSTRSSTSPTWPDTKPGLDALRALDPPVLLATLSNGTLRLLIDIARHNSLPLDAHFSGDLLGSYKPNPLMYIRACELFGFDAAARERGAVALCASHIDDLRAAAKEGLRTIYIRRATEDVGIPHGGDAVRNKRDGGEVDLVIREIGEIAQWVR